MMTAVINDERPEEAREYIRLSGERIAERDRSDIEHQRRALMADGKEKLEDERAKAVRWNTWLANSRLAADKRQWVAAFDWARRITEENPLHQEARDSQPVYKRFMARTVARGRFRDKKNALQYRAFLAYLNERHDEARNLMSETLDLEMPGGEISDDRVLHYLSGLSKPSEDKTPPAPAVPVRQGRASSRLAKAESSQAQTAPAPSVEQAASIPAVVSADPVPAMEAGPEPEPRSAAKRARPREKPALPAPGDWPYSQAVAAAKAKKWAQVVELLEQTLSEAPGHAYATRALPLARKRLDEQKVQRRVDAQRLYMEGIMLYGQGKSREALDRWRAALLADPGHAFSDRAIRHVERQLEASDR
jgi:hypothetical protein